VTVGKNLLPGGSGPRKLGTFLVRIFLHVLMLMNTLLRRNLCRSQRKGRSFKNWKFRVRRAAYEPDEDSWLNWNAAKDLATLHTYSQAHPELKMG
jgi:hypothetical protein